MPAYLNRRRAADRGFFADLYRPCDGCGEDLLDVHGTGCHPSDWCERRAARNPNRSRSAPIDLATHRRQTGKAATA